MLPRQNLPVCRPFLLIIPVIRLALRDEAHCQLIIVVVVAASSTAT
jgi:hypothetical protein